MVPLHAMEAFGDREGLAPAFLNLDTRRTWMISITLRPRFTPGKKPTVPIVQVAGWAPEPVWMQRVEETSSDSAFVTILIKMY
jgi:hypothetical protein